VSPYGGFGEELPLADFLADGEEDFLAEGLVLPAEPDPAELGDADAEDALSPCE
jgi:hypothetical protein